MADIFALNTFDKFYISGVLNNPIYTFMVRPVFVAFEFCDFVINHKRGSKINRFTI